MELNLTASPELNAAQADSDRKVSERNRNVLLLVAVAFLAGCMAVQAYAGAGGTEFSAAETLVEGWLGGMLGKLLAMVSVVVGLAMGIPRQNIFAVVLGFAMALVVNYAPNIIDTIVSGGLQVVL